MMKRTIGVIFVLLLLVVGTFNTAYADEKHIVALYGHNVVPGSGSSSTGMSIVEPNSNAGEIDFGICISNISNVTHASLHLGVSGSNGPVLATLCGNGSGRACTNYTGNELLTSGTLTGSDGNISNIISEIEAGNVYMVVYTSQNPGGDIRGQVPQ